MPIKHEWLDAGRTVVYLQLEGKLGAADFLDSNGKTIAMFESVDYPVDVIIDYQNQVYFSPDYVDTTNKMTLEHKNMRSVIFLGSKLAWELFSLYTQYYKDVSFVYAYAATMDEAQDMLRRIRAGKRIMSHRPQFPDLN